MCGSSSLDRAPSLRRVADLLKPQSHRGSTLVSRCASRLWSVDQFPAPAATAVVEPVRRCEAVVLGPPRRFLL